MPSGRTHDRITLSSLPVVVVLTFAQTRSSKLTLIVAGSFLFSGLMFGPDLDIYSQQFIRWGWLRWIWLPYQKSLHHRSFLSHGPVVGTVLRVVYLGLWGVAFVAVAAVVGEFAGTLEWNWESAGEILGRSLKQYVPESLALFVGLELGAMSHSLSDWCGSTYKRIKSKGFGAFFPQRIHRKKRGLTPSRSQGSRSSASRRANGNSKSRSHSKKS